MEKYKNMRCPDCQTVLGKIWPLEYGQLRLQLYCKKFADPLLWLTIL